MNTTQCGPTKVPDGDAGEFGCRTAWDGVVCWPTTAASSVVTVPCPAYSGFDTTKTVSKQCSELGEWAGLNSSNLRQTYSICLTPELLNLLKTLDEAGGQQQQSLKLSVAKATRIIEFLGLTFSLTTLWISIAIFSKFRVLFNRRTRIHRCLFVSMVVHCMVRLTLYLDQLVVRRNLSPDDKAHAHNSGIETNGLLCKSFYVVLEYSRTAMFMWMFVEGLNIYQQLTSFRGRMKFIYYHVVGWGAPVLLTLIWVSFMAATNQSKCWFAYSLSLHYWIIEGPRIATTLINLIFLLVTMRVLVNKLSSRPDFNHAEAKRIRKAVRATVVLLPLLGITNIAHMVTAPLHRSVVEFALWSIASHFLSSFQGFFVVLFYCFLNEESWSEVTAKLGEVVRIRQTLTDRLQSMSFRTDLHVQNALKLYWRNLQTRRRLQGRKFSAASSVQWDSSERQLSLHVSRCDCRFLQTMHTYEGNHHITSGC
ncbi:GPCR family 2 extracellular hormone receptor domain [Trinorchestia longiramus]|nr:GPCR family 2 extracellular hormone receptor domain [Trinorchestia longiramus]